MSNEAYRLLLIKRALARSDAELFGHRSRYLEVARRLAALLLATDLPDQCAGQAPAHPSDPAPCSQAAPA